MGAMSPGPWVQSGRVFSAEEIASIRTTVAWLPGLARRELVVLAAVQTRGKMADSAA